jgi:hypothetical protein
MAFEGRAHPVGAVQKFANGGWNEPGIGGAVSPIVPANVPWESANADSLWGPAIHWNTSINRYVVLLNRACCVPKWPQEGIYVMFGQDLSDPGTWTVPTRILAGSEIGVGNGYYPQIFGTGPDETDTLAGASMRLFIDGVSKWTISFETPSPAAEGPVPDPARENPSGRGHSSVRQR